MFKIKQMLCDDCIAKHGKSKHNEFHKICDKSHNFTRNPYICEIPLFIYLKYLVIFSFRSFRQKIDDFFSKRMPL